MSNNNQVKIMDINHFIYFIEDGVKLIQISDRIDDAIPAQRIQQLRDELLWHLQMPECNDLFNCSRCDQ